MPENAADFEVATVKAEDLDTEASITYRLVAGDLDKFAVHPETGVVRTLRGLDFERSQHYQLVVGTEEGRMLGKQHMFTHFQLPQTCQTPTNCISLLSSHQSWNIDY